jgi:hypothetical protein
MGIGWQRLSTFELFPTVRGTNLIVLVCQAPTMVIVPIKAQAIAARKIAAKII